MEREPNEALVQAAKEAVWTLASEHAETGASPETFARGMLKAVMDPARGLDQLVRIGDVLEWLEDADVMIDEITGARLARDLQAELGKET